MKPQAREIEEFRRSLLSAESFRALANDEWPPDLRKALNNSEASGLDVDKYITMVRIVAMNRFLLNHSSIAFLVHTNVGSHGKESLVHPIKPLVDKTIYQRGQSMTGVNFDLAAVRLHPESGDYLLVCSYREDINLIEAAPAEPWLGGEIREPGTPEGFVRLALALCEIDAAG
jgi:hypothetical protein